MFWKKKNHKTDNKRAKGFLDRVVLAIARNVFLDCLFILLLMLMLAGFFYYKYNVLTQKTEVESFERPFLLEKATYQKIVSDWQENEKKFIESDSKEYTDIFKKPTPPPENSSEGKK